MTQPVRCLRHLGRTAERFPPSARLLVAATIGLLWLGSAPALASGPEPVKPPASPKPGLRPEPAPVAAAQAPPSSTAGSVSASTPAAPPPPAIQPPASRATLVSSSRPAQPRSVRSSVAPAKPKLDPRPATKQRVQEGGQASSGPSDDPGGARRPAARLDWHERVALRGRSHPARSRPRRRGVLDTRQPGDSRAGQALTRERF